MQINRQRKIELIQRSLGLRHKLKVHESLETPTNHEDLAIMLLSKWELENELRAVEELIAHFRQEDVEEKKDLIEKGILKPTKELARRDREAAADEEGEDDADAVFNSNPGPKKKKR
jgi:hypothetical protein